MGNTEEQLFSDYSTEPYVLRFDIHLYLLLWFRRNKNKQTKIVCIVNEVHRNFVSYRTNESKYIACHTEEMNKHGRLECFSFFYFY